MWKKKINTHKSWGPFSVQIRASLSSVVLVSSGSARPCCPLWTVSENGLPLLDCYLLPTPTCRYYCSCYPITMLHPVHHLFMHSWKPTASPNTDYVYNNPETLYMPNRSTSGAPPLSQWLPSPAEVHTAVSSSESFSTHSGLNSQYLPNTYNDMFQSTYISSQQFHTSQLYQYPPNIRF